MTAPAQSQRLLVCNCQRTMEIDGRRLAEALSRDEPLQVHSELCRSQVAAFEQALASGSPLHVACTQEAPLFREVAEEKGEAGLLTFTNIRERAGWCSDKAAALPKMAALLAEAAQVAKPTGVATLTSQGMCLVYGAGQAALDAAVELSSRLSVTLMLSDATDALPPAVASVPTYKGRIRKASGHLGAFQIEVDGYAPMLPSSKAKLDFVMPRNGARSTCDIIFDMSGGQPLFADGRRRDGYIRVDPDHPASVARAMLQATDLVGEFEKPLYVSYDAGICAHARSQKVGCTKCLDNCPTGAISPAGDHVAIDAAICGGCGNCSAVCPTGAVSYAFPRRSDLVARLGVLLKTYNAAGGARPIVLFHDEKHGAPLVSVMARLGKGLPANVLPVSLFSVLQLGHDALASALAFGAEQIVILTPPEHPEELAALEAQAALTAALLDGLGYAGPRVRLIDERDPETVETLLHTLPSLPPLDQQMFTVLGTKRDIARTALGKLKQKAPAPAELIALPAGAPYGRISVNVAGCTLCLSCVGACPANALSDHPERPQVAFTEAACVQCGICVATCPEKVITLEPRYNFSPAAMTPDVIKAEEPFHCVSCGKPFGTRATVERVLDRLKGKHAMFQNEAQARLIQMCDTCRITAVSESGNDPFKGAARPRVRTTDDYLAEAQASKDRKTPEDYLN
ncbi:MAG: 4Fe-4S dicluster domain-containing protein [Hyphomicrobiaceae bacterium]|nr:MAG: 4Fe-4S dicluster domain-containing protein [Hyphomicrobiaceae bacterium]